MINFLNIFYTFKTTMKLDYVILRLNMGNVLYKTQNSLLGSSTNYIVSICSISVTVIAWMGL